ncbi:uncharacterized protein LOC128928120 [Callithrix jacchus]
MSRIVFIIIHFYLAGLVGHVRSWVQKWRAKRICPTGNEAPLQDQKKTLKRRENLKETSPDIEKTAAQYCHRAVQVPQDRSLEHIKDDELPRDVEKPAAWCHRRTYSFSFKQLPRRSAYANKFTYLK